MHLPLSHAASHPSTSPDNLPHPPSTPPTRTLILDPPNRGSTLYQDHTAAAVPSPALINTTNTNTNTNTNTMMLTGSTSSGGFITVGGITVVNGPPLLSQTSNKDSPNLVCPPLQNPCRCRRFPQRRGRSAGRPSAAAAAAGGRARVVRVPGFRWSSAFQNMNMNTNTNTNTGTGTGVQTGEMKKNLQPWLHARLGQSVHHLEAGEGGILIPKATIPSTLFRLPLH